MLSLSLSGRDYSDAAPAPSPPRRKSAGDGKRKSAAPPDESTFGPTLLSAKNKAYAFAKLLDSVVLPGTVELEVRVFVKETQLERLDGESDTEEPHAEAEAEKFEV